MLFTSEQVSYGHPDKICDQISDALLDAYLSEDKNSRVAIETLIKNNYITVAGEVTSNTKVDVDKVIRNVLTDINLENVDTYQITNLIDKQSPDIAQGVDIGGAGDQGIIFGYATDETPECLPLAYILATKALLKLKALNHPQLKQDAKSQVTVDYTENGIKIDTFLISTQHTKEIQQSEIYNIVSKVMKETAREYGMNEDFKILVNPTGRFVIGGSFGDCGVTGRKIIADSYGGYAKHGGGAYCVDGETEFLTKDGWKKISEYNGSDLIAQYDGKNIEFVKPINYYSVEAEKMYHLESQNGLDMVVSQNHDMVFRTSKGNLIKKRVVDIIDERNGLMNGFTGRVPISFNYNPNSSISLTNDEIRLQCAFCADGSIIENNSNWRGRVRVKKQYKIDSMYDLLNKTKIQYKVTRDDEYFIFWFNPPLLTKSLKTAFSNASLEQMKVIVDEVVLWDGDKNTTFRTTQKEDADFIQLAFIVTTGNGASIRIDDRIGEVYKEDYIRKSICYEVQKLQHSDVGLKRKRHANSLIIDEYSPEDNKMYCFTVPTGMFLARRNNKIFVTGNCGKDPTKVDRSAAYMARYLAKYLLKRHNLKSCEVQLAYAIGVAQPVSINISCDMSDWFIKGMVEHINSTFDLSPKGIINFLDLKNVKYYDTAKYGHFTNQNFNWERV